MIDTKVLRVMVEEDGKSGIDLEEIHELLGRLEEAESDAIEQARLNGMGASRELALMAKLEAAEKENAKLREALAQKVTSETILRDLNVGNGSINASFEGGAVRLFVDAFANQFVESGAANYLEMQFHSEATGPLVVTLQRANGKTPHQLRAEAEQERDALRAKIEHMEKQEPVAWRRRSDYGWSYKAKPVNGLVLEPLYLAPGAQPKLDEIKSALQRALELGKRETWTGAKKHRSREDQREEQQCWDKVWALLGAKGEEK